MSDRDRDRLLLALAGGRPDDPEVQRLVADLEKKMTSTENSRKAEIEVEKEIREEYGIACGNRQHSFGHIVHITAYLFFCL